MYQVQNQTLFLMVICFCLLLQDQSEVNFNLHSYQKLMGQKYSYYYIGFSQNFSSVSPQLKILCACQAPSPIDFFSQTNSKFKCFDMMSKLLHIYFTYHCSSIVAKMCR